MTRHSSARPRSNVTDKNFAPHRYRKGKTEKWSGLKWYEMHRDIMFVSANTVVSLAITAVSASEGLSTTSHSRWGYYMVAGVAVQVFTGWLRTQGLKGNGANFSYMHRVRITSLFRTSIL